MEKEKAKAFHDAAKPLMEWLKENMHPINTVIVTADKAELLEGQAMVTIERAE